MGQIEREQCENGMAGWSSAPPASYQMRLEGGKMPRQFTESQDMALEERNMTDPVHKAARWLAETSERQRPPHLLAYLQHEFSLTATQAVQAIREANLIRARAT